MSPTAWAADEAYVRSWRGNQGGWYREVQRTRKAHVGAGGVKRDVTFLDPGARDEARATTLRLVAAPAGGSSHR